MNCLTFYRTIQIDGLCVLYQEVGLVDGVQVAR